MGTHLDELLRKKMNHVPVIVRNPAYVAEVELGEDEVDPTDLAPLVSGNDPIVTAPASEDEDVAEDVVEDGNDDEEMEDIPKILQDVISSLGNLIRRLETSCPPLLGTQAPNSPL